MDCSKILIYTCLASKFCGENFHLQPVNSQIYKIPSKESHFSYVKPRMDFNCENLLIASYCFPQARKINLWYSLMHYRVDQRNYLIRFTCTTSIKNNQILELSRAHTPCAMAPVNSRVWNTQPRALDKQQCITSSPVSSMLRCRYRLYYSTTITHFEIEHAQQKKHMALVGVVDRRGR